MATLASHDCPDCLPDCEDTTYQHSITSTTLRRCDARNLNLQPLCTLERGPLPKLWLAQVEEVYRRTTNSTPPYIAALAGRRSRHLDTLLELPSDTKSDTYDAWEEDIALINIYFGKASYTGRLVMSVVEGMTFIGYEVGYAGKEDIDACDVVYSDTGDDEYDCPRAGEEDEDEPH